MAQITIEQIVEHVAKQMVESAEILPDKTGLFYGSPRPIMESISVSSGPAYKKLKSMGIQDLRKGKSGIWSIPEDIMQQYIDL